MDNGLRERRSRKRERKRPRSASSSSENINASVSRSSSRRHKSKRRRRHSSKRRRSKELRDSRRKSKKRTSSVRNRSSTGNARSVSGQTNTTIISEAVQHRINSQHTSKTAVPTTSTSLCAVPSTSSAHLASRPGSLLHVNTSPARSQKQGRESGSVRQMANSRQAMDTKRQMRKNNMSNVSEQLDSSQPVNMMTNACLVNQNKRQSPLEEHSESELQCSICSELFVKATMLSCIHTFCKYCIEMWKRNKAECPLCRTPIKSECRITKFDLMIEQITQATEQSKKQRLEIVKEREELEANLSSHQRQSSAQQGQLGTPSWGLTGPLRDLDNGSESDNETNYDSDYPYNGNVVFTDVDGEDVDVDYTYISDTEEEDAQDDIGVITGYEDYNGYTDNDDNDNHEFPSDFDGSANEHELYELSDDVNNSNSNGSNDDSDINDIENLNYDENASNDSTEENNDNADGDGYEIDGNDDDNAYEDVIASGNSDYNSDIEVCSVVSCGCFK